MKMKTYVIQISKTFPATHSRKGEKTNFAELIEGGIKLHTLRKNYALWKHRIEQVNAGLARLELRQWTGQPYRSKQETLFAFTGDQVGIEQVSRDANGRWWLQLDDEARPISERMLAGCDGLRIVDFWDWFEDYDAEKHGGLAVIHFTKFRYAE